MNKKPSSKKEEDLYEDRKQQKEDEIAEKIFKYSQGCSVLMVMFITLLVFLLLFLFK